MVAAGFVGFEITWMADVFSGAPQASSAAAFGTVGINFRAQMAQDAAEWEGAVTALSCHVPENGSQAGGKSAHRHQAMEREAWQRWE